MIQRDQLPPPATPRLPAPAVATGGTRHRHVGQRAVGWIRRIPLGVWVGAFLLVLGAGLVILVLGMYVAVDAMFIDDPALLDTRFVDELGITQAAAGTIGKVGLALLSTGLVVLMASVVRHLVARRRVART